MILFFLSSRLLSLGLKINKMKKNRFHYLTHLTVNEEKSFFLWACIQWLQLVNLPPIIWKWILRVCEYAYEAWINRFYFFPKNKNTMYISQFFWLLCVHLIPFILLYFFRVFWHAAKKLNMRITLKLSWLSRVYVISIFVSLA